MDVISFSECIKSVDYERESRVADMSALSLMHYLPYFPPGSGGLPEYDQPMLGELPTEFQNTETVQIF
jgi:hypothetical protein